jgi:UDP-N-acetylmuramoyl-tripeptide--D-alanyl-D-alanine ligase
MFSFSWTSYMRKEKQKKPLVFTPRVYRIGITLTIIYGAIAWFGMNAGFNNRSILPDLTILSLIWVLADILIPILVLFAGALMKPVENRIQEGFKNKARAKIAGMKDLQIIAITGSYGKTSTKFILKTLLSERYNVCFTPGSFNTPMGICKVINDDLQANHQILILEMGARYKGNIKELCDIARPHVSVVTNVGQAHLETFGSVENIALTKSEIIEGLHHGGTAIINSDDSLVTSMRVRPDISVVNAGLESGIFSVQNITYDKNGCQFTVTDPDGNTCNVTTPLLGEHNIQNLIIGFATARHFGIRTETLAIAATKVEPVEHRLNLIQSGDVTIIDDAFNSNPVGARNAVEVLSKFTGGRRILVTPGMVELGDVEAEENQKWGHYIAKSGIEFVLLIGKKRTEPIAKGLFEEGYPPEQILVFESFFDARAWLNENQLPGDIILYENDLPDVYDA